MMGMIPTAVMPVVVGLLLVFIAYQRRPRKMAVTARA
jgi:hypothetical protein